MSEETDEKWAAAARQHLATVQLYVETASKLGSDSWLPPKAERKWSPAEITEHLKLVYEASLRELRGGAAIKIRSGWLVQRFLRLFILPRIFKKGEFPKGAKSPQEMRPANVIKDRSEALTTFTSLANVFQSEMAKRKELKETRLTHHIFGHLSALEGMRLLTMHIAHYQKQLP